MGADPSGMDKYIVTFPDGSQKTFYSDEEFNHFLETDGSKLNLSWVVDVIGSTSTSGYVDTGFEGWGPEPNLALLGAASGGAASGGATSARGAVPQSPKPKIDCNTVLPNGRTIGDYVRQYRSQLQKAVHSASEGPMPDPFGAALGGMFFIGRPRGPIDFKNIFRGQANGLMLGKAGNFAYYAIGTGILPNAVLDAGAGFYSFYANKDASHTHGFWGIDDSAFSVRDAALASNGCK